VLAYKHLQLEVHALRRLADPPPTLTALDLEIAALKARMAAANDAADVPGHPLAEDGSVPERTRA